MKIAIISDIHGNLEALTEALAYLDTHPVDRLHCLGDIIGYGANPNECCELIRRHNAVSVLGNHDEALWNDELLTHFSPLAMRAMRWTRSVISDSVESYLRSLPLVATVDESTFVHSSLENPSDYPYLFSDDDARISLRLSATSMCWIGHTHSPAIYSEEGEVFAVAKGPRYIVNVGSVGQPRDADPRLSFGIFDAESYSYENIRLPYDVHTACKKIIDAGLPPRLGERLLAGH